MQINTIPTVKPINQYRPYWAKRFGTSKMLPMSREEMDDLGWDSCDIILVTGDAYIDHPSFGMALVGRLLDFSLHMHHVAADIQGFPVDKMEQLYTAADYQFALSIIPLGIVIAAILLCFVRETHAHAKR